MQHNWSSTSAVQFKPLYTARLIIISLMLVLFSTINAQGQCTAAAKPIFSFNDSTICEGNTVTVTVSGNLNDASTWYMYRKSCDGYAPYYYASDSGTTFTIEAWDSVYYFRGAGSGCVPDGPCDSLRFHFTPRPDLQACNNCGLSEYAFMCGKDTIELIGAFNNQALFPGSSLEWSVHDDNYDSTVTGVLSDSSILNPLFSPNELLLPVLPTSNFRIVRFILKANNVPECDFKSDTAALTLASVPTIDLGADTTLNSHAFSVHINSVMNTGITGQIKSMLTTNLLSNNKPYTGEIIMGTGGGFSTDFYYNLGPKDMYADSMKFKQCIYRNTLFDNCPVVCDSMYVINNFSFVDSLNRFKIEGNIYDDTNCVINGIEEDVQGWLVGADPGTYSLTDSNGHYIVYTDTGNTTLRTYVSGGISFAEELCGSSTRNLYFDTTSNDTSGIDFHYLIPKYTKTKVCINNARRHRCFVDHYWIKVVNYGNQTLTGAKLYVDLPDIVELRNINKPYTINSKGYYVFQLPDIKRFGWYSVSFVDSVICIPEIRDRTYETRAWVEPDNKVYYDNFTGKGVDAGWDQSELEVLGECKNDSLLKFQIINKAQAGVGDMSGPQTYYLYRNSQLILTNSFQLIGGDVLTLILPSDGYTYWLRTKQHHAYPALNLSVGAVVEACGTDANGAIHLGDYPCFGGELASAVSCDPVTDSYDPNDKNVTPAGMYDNHYVSPGTRLEYKIRFQNTGTDTAYKVVVLDTLSPYLDISTLELFPASHEYEFDVNKDENYTVLVFTFDNIYLVDSTTNEPESKGAFMYSIEPYDSLPEKTEVHNTAAIYFDFNEPIITNDAWITLYDSVQPGPAIRIIDCDTTVAPSASLSVSDTVICYGESVQISAAGGTSYKWLKGDLIQNKFTPVTNAQPASTQYYQVEVMDSNSCYTTIDSILIQVLDLPVITANVSDSEICVNDSVTFTGSGGSTYVWNNGISNGQPFIPLASQYYSVMGTDNNGCANTDSVFVTVLPLPVLNTTVSKSHVCDGDSISLTTTGANTINWSNGIPEGTLFEAQQEMLYVTGTDLNGCTNNDSLYIEVDSTETVADFMYSSLGLNVSFTELSDTAIAWHWTFGGTIGSSLQNPVYAFDTAGEYEVCLSAIGHCHNDTICKQVVVDTLIDGINALNGTEEILVYPNPAKGMVFIRNLQTAPNTIISFYDVTGRCVMIKDLNEGQNMNEQTVPTYMLNKGLYHYVITSNQKIITKGKIELQP